MDLPGNPALEIVDRRGGPDRYRRRLASTAMLAPVNSIIGGGRYLSMALVAGFAALCVILPVARYVS